MFPTISPLEPSCSALEPSTLACPAATFQARPHLIEVELEELELHPDAPDLKPGLFELHGNQGNRWSFRHPFGELAAIGMARLV